MKKSIVLTIAIANTLNCFSQLNWQKGGNNAGPPLSQPIIGTSGIYNAPLLFHTFGIQRMVINDNTGPTAGFVGIGLPAPAFNLDVQDNTNLNIAYLTNPGFGYRINGIKLLSNPGLVNTFVGENAGASWSLPITYTYCTFVGANAGPVNQADANTFLGESEVMM